MNYVADTALGIALFTLIASTSPGVSAQRTDASDANSDYASWCYYSPLYPIEIGPGSGGFASIQINDDCSYTVNGQTFMYTMPAGYGLMDRVMPTWLKVRIGMALSHKRHGLRPLVVDN
jgi:hypothetical protein